MSTVSETSTPAIDTSTPETAPVREVVPDDVYDALKRAIEETGEQFDPAAWSFRASSVFGWAAQRVDEPHSVLVISPDCRSRWATLPKHSKVTTCAGTRPGTQPYEDLADFDSPLEAVFTELAAETPMERGHIEFLLVDESRWHRGPWHFRPVEALGWVCTRSTALRTKRQYAVSRAGQVERVGRHQSAEEVLRGLVSV